MIRLFAIIGFIVLITCSGGTGFGMLLETIAFFLGIVSTYKRLV